MNSTVRPTPSTQRGVRAMALLALVGLFSMFLSPVLSVRADNLVNDINSVGDRTISAGGSTEISYKVNSNGGDGQNGCNASDGSPATVTLSVPADVTASTTSLTFNTCGDFKPVTFSSSKPGNYPINVSSIADSGAGSYSNQANFTLIVSAPPDSTAPVITPNVVGTLGLKGWYTSDVTVSWSVVDNESAISSSTGCTSTTVTADTAGTTFTCSAASAGGTSSQSVTIKRDNTAPNMSVSDAYRGDSDPSLDYTADTWTHNSGVTVEFTCSDATSGVASYDDKRFTSDEGSTSSVTGQCTDNAGNQNSASFGPIKIDRTAPQVTGTLDPASPNGDNGWYTAPVSVSWSGDDSKSGVNEVSGLDSCDADATYSGPDSATASVTGHCDDIAGNTGTGTVQFKYDATAPVVGAASLSGTAGTSGWYTSSVTVNWTCTDATSGAVDANPSQTISAEGTSTVTPTCQDNAGNTASASSAVTVKIDKTDPVITLVSRTAANGNGWNNGNVTVNWSCTDGGSDVVAASVSQTVSTEGANQSVTGTCTDNAGNSASDTVGGISIDKTAPTISGAPDRAANANGWYNADVTVSFTCSDGGSGLAAGNPNPASQNLGEGANQSASSTCADKAGNSSSATVSGINIDKTAPTASLVGGPTNKTYYVGLDPIPAAPTCNASDTLSGLDGVCSVDGYSTALGGHTITASATDKAGNTGNATSVTYIVDKVTFGNSGRFFQPVDMGTAGNATKLGSTVPLKFTVMAGGVNVTNTSIVKSITVSPTATLSTVTPDPIEEYSTGGTSLRYDATAGQFIYNFQFAKTKFTVGKTYIVTITLEGGEQISASFTMK